MDLLVPADIVTVPTGIRISIIIAKIEARL
jgi:hypothetical protein